MSDWLTAVFGEYDQEATDDLGGCRTYSRNEMGPSDDLDDDVCYRTLLWMDRVRAQTNVSTQSGPSKRRRKRFRTKPLLSCFKTRKAFYEHLRFDADGVSDEPEHIHLLQEPGVGFSFWKED